MVDWKSRFNLKVGGLNSIRVHWCPYGSGNKFCFQYTIICIFPFVK